MRKIIKNAVYDTATARKIGETECEYPVYSPMYEKETLYRKRTGEYFLHCYGGEKSNHRKRIDKKWAFGEKILPITYDEAMEWISENKIQMEQEDFYEKSYLTIYIENGTIGLLRKRAERSEKSISEIADAILRKSLKTYYVYRDFEDYGQDYPVCFDRAEAVRLCIEYYTDESSENFDEMFAEAGQADVDRYGVYNSVSSTKSQEENEKRLKFLFK